MKEINLKWLAILSVTILFCTITSCSDDHKDSDSDPKGTYSKPCLDWGAEKNIVSNYMNGFNLTDEETDYLYYAGKKTENIISYQFKDGKLCTAALTIPSSSTSLSALNSTFSAYISLGEINSAQVYVNETKNIVATISTVVKGGTSYYAIGWRQLNLQE